MVLLRDDEGDELEAELWSMVIVKGAVNEVAPGASATPLP
jgi:hypothetical protein